MRTIQRKFKKIRNVIHVSLPLCKYIRKQRGCPPAQIDMCRLSCCSHPRQVVIATATAACAAWRAAGGRGPAGAGPRRAWTLAVWDAGFHGWDPAGEAALELLVAEVRAAEAAASACTGERARVVAAAAAPTGGAQEVAVWLAGGDGRAAVVVEVGAAAAWARARGAVLLQVRGAVAAGSGAEDREAARCCASALRAGSEVRCIHRLRLRYLALRCCFRLRVMWKWVWSNCSMQ